MKKLSYIIGFFLSVILVNVLLINTSLAVTSNNYKCPYTDPQECIAWSLNQAGGEAGFETGVTPKVFVDVSAGTISEKIGQIVSYTLAFLGVLFLIISIASGIQWMTAGGNEEKVTKARERLMNAVVGLIIVVMAYAITWFVVSKLQDSIDPPPPPPPPPAPECTVDNYPTECIKPGAPCEFGDATRCDENGKCECSDWLAM